MVTAIIRAREDTRKALHEAAGRAVECAARRAYGKMGRRFCIEKDLWGKPFGRNGRKIVALSLSHSFPFAFGAVMTESDVVIGADIERIRFFTPHLRDAFLTKNEETLITTAPIERHAFLETLSWSLKESVLKALGIGLRMHPKSVDISDALGRESYASITIEIQGSSIKAECFFQEIDNTHVASAIVFSHKSAMIRALHLRYGHGNTLCHH